MTRLMTLLCVVTLSVACKADAPSLTTPTEQPRSIANLAGTYAATMEFSTSCAATPELSTPRSYQVTLQTTPFTYLGIFVAGGGYTKASVVGDMWPNLTGVSLRWNSADVNECAEWSPEPLSGGRMLMVCGDWGSGAVTQTTIEGDMPAEVFIIAADGERRRACSGMHQFTFTRVTPQSVGIDPITVAVTPGPPR